ncbi:NADPH:quinone reductase [Actinomadura sp. NBRC 104412]|uniref:NAD(P)-dependent alcohol dehydrogenase n=1 Tax=Actinomadura sp. NBRC 104412 TaxID=3032203 RepID=UPI0024A282D0|nr:NAD(P)-dependent alcohol dehydrogenase [Actinomadura sp. NBRC 104412]GLZ05232.1 NADPH:quinone reductase [Actinomadura sp. NBRC 104412]
MKAIVQDVYGGALELRDLDRPAPRDDEVLVRVHAAAVDWGVWHVSTGRPYLFRLIAGLRGPRQKIQGTDLAGTVERTGSKVTAFAPGDEVFGSSPGAFAEYVCVKERRLAPKPHGLTFEEAAASPISGAVAIQALRGKAKARPGQKILIIGASGGIGTFAVQLAAADGLEVTGVCGPGKDDLLRSLGASQIIDYTKQDLTDTSERYDIILDIAGNRPLNHLRRALAPNGVLIMAGGEDGGAVLGGLERQFRALLLTPFIRQRLRSLLTLVRKDDLLTLTELAGKGALKPVIDRTYPLAEAATALHHLETGHPRGKLVLTI